MKAEDYDIVNEHYFMEEPPIIGNGYVVRICKKIEPNINFQIAITYIPSSEEKESFKATLYRKAYFKIKNYE